MAEEINVESLTPEEIQAIIKERDEAKDGLKNTVEEIKSIRKAKQDAEAERDEAKRLAEEAKNLNRPQDDIDKILEQKLAEKLSLREKAEADIQRAIAWKEFISANPEFSDEADATGLRQETLKRELGRFNLSEARTKDDFISAMNDAKMLIYRKENKEYTAPYASSPQNGGGNPGTAPDSGLSADEKETMKRLGWDIKKFNEMKLKHPDLYKSVFNK